MNELNISIGKFPINQLLGGFFVVNRNNWPTSLWLTKKKKKILYWKVTVSISIDIFFFFAFNELSWFGAFARDYETIIWNETYCFFLLFIIKFNSSLGSLSDCSLSQNPKISISSNTTTITFRPYVIYSNAMCCMNEQTTKQPWTMITKVQKLCC